MFSLSIFLLRFRNKLRISKVNTISIEKKTKISGCTFTIKGENNRLKIHEGCVIRDSTIEINGNNCTIEIGKNTLIGRNCYLSSRELKTKLIIGDNCNLSRNINIMTSDGHNILHNNNRINYSKNITIENHVWLADNVTILKGVTVATNTIVGINSTLTKSTNSNSIYAGNPATLIKKNIIWDKDLSY